MTIRRFVFTLLSIRLKPGSNVNFTCAKPNTYSGQPKQLSSAQLIQTSNLIEIALNYQWSWHYFSQWLLHFKIPYKCHQRGQNRCQKMQIALNNLVARRKRVLMLLAFFYCELPIETSLFLVQLLVLVVHWTEILAGGRTFGIPIQRQGSRKLSEYLWQHLTSFWTALNLPCQANCNMWYFATSGCIAIPVVLPGSNSILGWVPSQYYRVCSSFTGRIEHKTLH